MPYDQDDNGQAHISKLMLHECLKHIMVWSSRAELFHYRQSASGFMNQHVLFHESVSISPHFIADSLLSIITHQQVRLTESHHPHIEQLMFRSGDFRQDLKELEISPSRTVSQISVNPWISSSPKPSQARRWNIKIMLKRSQRSQSRRAWCGHSQVPKGQQPSYLSQLLS